MKPRKHRTLQTAIKHGLQLSLQYRHVTKKISHAHIDIEREVLDYLERVVGFALANRHLSADHILLLIKNPLAFDPLVLEMKLDPKDRPNEESPSREGCRLPSPRSELRQKP